MLLFSNCCMPLNHKNNKMTNDLTEKDLFCFYVLSLTMTFERICNIQIQSFNYSGFRQRAGFKYWYLKS